MNFTIAVHGGSFQSSREIISFESENKIKIHVKNALKIGYDKLKQKEKNINIVEPVKRYILIQILLN